MKKIIWAPRALEDLKDARDFIALDNPKKAEMFVADIIDRIEKLARFEKLGRMIPEIGESRYREFIVSEYRVFHEIRDHDVLIFRVLHSKRLFSD